MTDTTNDFFADAPDTKPLMDADGFVELVLDSQRLVDLFEKAVRRAGGSGLRLEDYAALRGLARPAEADAEDEDKAKGKPRKAAAVMKGLARRGLVREAGGEDSYALTDEGRAALAAADAVVDGIIGALNNRKRPLSGKVAKALTKANRAIRDQLRGQAKAGGGAEGHDDEGDDDMA